MLNNEKSDNHGYDNPLQSPTMDMLKRQNITQRIYSLLTNSHNNCSVRIGLLAPWGEGKTTICNWIEKQAETDDNIIIRYSPWSAKTDSEIWHVFYGTVSKELSKRIRKPWIKQKWTAVVGCLSRVFRSNTTKELSKLHAYSQIGLNFLLSLSSSNKATIEKLSSKLPTEKRRIVIIDDIDRMDPVLIPKFLLILREIMDIDGFSFLIAFDKEVVTEALIQHSSSKKYGEDFLEKILEHQIHLNPTTEENILSLFKYKLEKHCPFINNSKWNNIAKFLPRNPRELKSLVRKLSIYENEANRHREDEIDWIALLLGQMIQIESKTFFQNYIKDTFFRNNETNANTTTNPWINADIEFSEHGNNAKELDRINKLLDANGIDDSEKRERLRSLCEELRESYGFIRHNVILYAIKLVDNPDIMTWKEFDFAYDLWIKNPQFNDILQWIENHSDSMKISKADVIRELLTTTLQHYSELLEKAANIVSLAEHKDTM